MKYKLTKQNKNHLKKNKNSKSFKLNVLKILNSAKKCPKKPKYSQKNVLNILKKHDKAFLNSFLIGLPMLEMSLRWASTNSGRHPHKAFKPSLPFCCGSSVSQRWHRTLRSQSYHPDPCQRRAESCSRGAYYFEKSRKLWNEDSTYLVLSC